MYADTMTRSMQEAITETDRRRNYQMEYNRIHGITPKTVIKEIKNGILVTEKAQPENKKMTRSEVTKEIERLTGLMKMASAQLDFEACIKLRDTIMELKQLLKKK